MRELNGQLPAHLLPFWAQECRTCHKVGWWSWHWERTGLIQDVSADVLPGGWKFWLQWKKARAQAEGKSSADVSYSGVEWVLSGWWDAENNHYIQHSG